MPYKNKEQRKAHIKAYVKRYASRLKALGLCRRCRQKSDGFVYCPACRERDSWEQRRIHYGIDKTSFLSLWNAQNGKCAICKTILESYGRGNLDHDHVTGVIRGILCHKCNRGLGLFNDNVARLKTAIDYLSK